MSFRVFLGLFAPILVTGLLMFLLKSERKDSIWLKFIIAFSGAYLLALCFLDIIPEIYFLKDKNAIPIGFFILLGFFIQIVLDVFTHGIEHGHHQHTNKTYNAIPISMFVALCLHSFLEGMPLAKNLYNSTFQNKLLTGIIIHNIPITIVLMFFFIQSNIKKVISAILLIIFALSAPLGVLSSSYIGSHLIANMTSYFTFTMAIVVGIFIHISTTILFETEENHKFNFYKLGFVMLGILLAIINM
jgi:zinc transporter ZupT